MGKGDQISKGKPILQKVWMIWSPLLYFHFKSSMDPNFSSFIIFQCILLDSGVLFWEFSSFYKLPRGDLISGGNQFWRKSGLFGTPIPYFNFKTFLGPNSFSFIKYQYILPNSGALFSEFWNCYKLKRGGRNFWGKPILQKVWIIWSPLLYFHFKSSMDPNFSSFIIFQCILLDSGVPFSEFLNFYKLPRGDLISKRNQFWRKSELFCTPHSVF